MSIQYIKKNVAFVVGALQTAIKSEDNIELSRIALLMPLLMDDSVVSKINDDSIQYDFENLISANKMILANYNDRYLSVLPLIYQAIALMLDIEAISMRNGCLTRANIDILSQMISNCNSQSLCNMCRATERILRMTEGKSIAKLYNLLKVEI